MLLFTLSWIYSLPGKCMALPCTGQGFSFHIAAPLPPPLQAPKGPTVGCSNSLGSPLLPAVAAFAGINMLQPMSNPVAPSVRRRVCARQGEAGGNFLYPCLWISHQQKVVYTSLASCLPGRGFRRIWGHRIKIRQIPGNMSHMHHIFGKV